jgi:hypothetical protein
MISLSARAGIDLMTRLPRFVRLDDYFPCLCRIVAQTSGLHPDTVCAVGRAVFPISRARKDRPRFTPILQQGQVVGIYDDNTTPTWALLWSHGIAGGSRAGWAFAHVWTVSDDIKSYTHPANLAMLPECLASLTDKSGPLNGVSPVARMARNVVNYATHWGDWALAFALPCISHLVDAIRLAPAAIARVSGSRPLQT